MICTYFDIPCEAHEWGSEVHRLMHMAAAAACNLALRTTLPIATMPGGHTLPARAGCVVFGHSLGGCLASLVQLARPQTFSAIYMFEPVMQPSSEARRAREVAAAA